MASITKSTGRQDQIAHAAVSLAQGEPYRCHGAVCKATASWWCPKTKCGHHDAVGCDPPLAPAWSTHRSGTSHKVGGSSKIWCERVAKPCHSHARCCCAGLCANWLVVCSCCALRRPTHLTAGPRRQGADAVRWLVAAFCRTLHRPAWPHHTDRASSGSVECRI